MDRGLGVHEAAQADFLPGFFPQQPRQLTGMSTIRRFRNALHGGNGKAKGFQNLGRRWRRCPGIREKFPEPDLLGWSGVELQRLVHDSLSLQRGQGLGFDGLHHLGQSRGIIVGEGIQPHTEHGAAIGFHGAQQGSRKAFEFGLGRVREHQFSQSDIGDAGARILHLHQVGIHGSDKGVFQWIPTQPERGAQHMGIEWVIGQREQSDERAGGWTQPGESAHENLTHQIFLRVRRAAFSGHQHPAPSVKGNVAFLLGQLKKTEQQAWIAQAEAE